MAEGSSFNSTALDIDNIKIASSQGPNVEFYPQFPGTYDFIIDDDPDRFTRFIRQFEDVPTEPNQAEIEKDACSDQSFRAFGTEFAPLDYSIFKTSFSEFTRIDENGLVQLVKEKIERKNWPLSLDETTEVDPSEKDKYANFLKDRVSNFYKLLEEAQISLDPTEQEKSVSPEKQTEKLTEFKYEKKNKLWDRKSHLRLMCNEFSQRKSGEVTFTKEGLENFSEGLLNFVESDLHPAINILRRIAYPKLCEKHFSPEFPSGAFAQEDEPVENISISMNHVEFCHKELSVNFLELLNREDFDNVVLDFEKNPEINNILPSFVKFLNSSSKFQNPKGCFTIILAILKNPYRSFEFVYDDKLPVVEEQTGIAEYLMNCLIQPNIITDKVISEKLVETIIRFANIHPSFLAEILEGFSHVFSNPPDILVYQIYCQVLNIMTSIGATIISLCLPQHFRSLSCLVDIDENCELYFHLLRACEISLADTIENERQLEAEFPGENKLNSFYYDCYNFFGIALTYRLISAFRKYENRKDREEKYLSRKHAIYLTKDGYMDTEMQYLTNRYKKRDESESLNLPIVKKCTFNSAGKVLCSSNAQLGCIIQKDMSGLSEDDLEYWKSIDNFPLSYLAGITELY